MASLWKTFARMGAAYARSAGEEKKAEDENTTGKDDLYGVSLVYAADLLDAVLAGKTPPKAPSVLK